MCKLNFLEDSYVSIYEYFGSNCYIIISHDEAIIIDPHTSKEIENLLIEKNIKKLVIILTHEHCDHISGIWWYLEKYECKIICSEMCAVQISNKKCTRPLMISFKLQEDDIKNGTNKLQQFKEDYVWTTYNADITFKDKMHYVWNNHNFEFKVIRGHSEGSCFILLDNKYVFSGDSLLKEFPIITSFPNGNKYIYLNESIPIMEKKLKADMIVLPGHGEPFRLEDIMKNGEINVELR